MLVVKLELHPKGDESKKVDMGTAHIVNIGGTREMGAYAVRLLKAPAFSSRPGTIWRAGMVDAFPRKDKRWGPWELLALALESAVGLRIMRVKEHVQARSGKPAASDPYVAAAEEIEENIAMSLECALVDGDLSPENFVAENRDVLRKIVRSALGLE